jgi:Tat protein secretion system quality control protein TatD with DNase activity
VRYTVEKLALVRGVSAPEMAATVARNARRLFSLA